MTLAEALAGSDALEHLDAADDAAWRATDPHLLALCRNRMAMLLGCRTVIETMPADVRDDLAAWPSSEAFDDTSRAALAFTEHYVIDVATLSDETVGALRERLGDAGLVDFVNALLVVEQRMTLEMAFEAVL